MLNKLLSSFCDLPILDSSGKDRSSKTGIPPVVFISYIFFNLFLDDLDREVEVRFPNLQDARFQHEMFIIPGAKRSFLSRSLYGCFE